MGRPGWKINRRDTLRELNEAAIGDEIQCVYSLKQLKKISYKGPYSMKQVQEMRCTKGTSKSPQALPPVKHTSLPPFYCLPQTQLNKWHWIAYLSLIFFRSAEKKHVQNIITKLILTYLITICWNVNLCATSNVSTSVPQNSGSTTHKFTYCFPRCQYLPYPLSL